LFIKQKDWAWSCGENGKSIVKNDEVFVVLGDTICEYDVKAVIDSPHSMLGVRKVDDPREFGVAKLMKMVLLIM
jgi:dTDP-glucose pyrophosphorylase